MAAYHQMGDKSRNLVMDPVLSQLYAGAITSPVNEDPGTMRALCQEIASIDLVFDPQTYNPRSDRGKLARWPYFGELGNYETAAWQDDAWGALLGQIVEDCVQSGHSAVCSPAVAGDSTDENLGAAMTVGDALAVHIANRGIEGLQTAFLRPSTLGAKGRPATVASILTNGTLERTYCIANWESTEDHVADVGKLVGFGQTLALIAPMRRVLVGFCGPDMILWKAAGAESVATGKHDNQLRWTSSRWDPQKSGGRGGTAYYFEDSLLAWLRTEDIVRLQEIRFPLGLAEDPFFPVIMEHVARLAVKPRRRVDVIKNGKPVIKNGKVQQKVEGPPAWTGIGWRQWLWWFAHTERRLSRGSITARELVNAASKNWETLRDHGFRASDDRNDGRWLASWSATLDGLGA